MTHKTSSTIETVKQLVKTALRFARTLRNKKPKFLRVLIETSVSKKSAILSVLVIRM